MSDRSFSLSLEEAYFAKGSSLTRALFLYFTLKFLLHNEVEEVFQMLVSGQVLIVQIDCVTYIEILYVEIDEILRRRREI